MMRYAPQTAEVLRTVLDGLDPDMPVELESGVPLIAVPWLTFAPSTLGPRTCV